jgi:hypothetical protein
MMMIFELKFFCGADLLEVEALIPGKIPMVYKLCMVYWSFVIPL